MSNSTNAMNNVSKIQTTTGSGKKTSTDPKEVATQFEALFSSAIVQLAPNAQLNTIEAQLRESLFKQDSKQTKKYTESNINTEAAQSTLWAQRNWMQDSRMAPAPQAAPDNTARPIEQAAPPAQPTNKTNADDNKAAANRPVEQSATNKAANKTQQDAKQAAEVPEAQPQPGMESTAAIESEANAASAGLAATTASKLIATQEQSIKPATDLDTMSIDTAELAKANVPTEQLAATATTNSDQSATRISNPLGLDDKINAKVDAVLNNSTVSVRPENTASNAAGNNMTNANAVAAQLAPQIAQQAASAAEQEGLQEIQAGQKLMAGSSLQTPTTNAALAAGTNGLNSAQGVAQQALIKTPVTQPGFAKEIGQTVQWAIGKNLSTVDIRVNPETFGPMNMRLVQKGQQVQLIIRTQDETSSNLLTQALSGLKEVLGQQGIQLTQVQIQHTTTTNTNTQTNNPQHQFDQNNNSGRGGQQSGKGGNSQPDEAQLQATTPATKTQGKLDLFA